MLGNPSLESDIRVRAAVLAEAILAANPYSTAIQQACDELWAELEEVTPATGPDDLVCRGTRGRAGRMNRS